MPDLTLAKQQILRLRCVNYCSVTGNVKNNTGLGFYCDFCSQSTYIIHSHRTHSGDGVNKCTKRPLQTSTHIHTFKAIWAKCLAQGHNDKVGLSGIWTANQKRHQGQQHSRDWVCCGRQTPADVTMKPLKKLPAAWLSDAEAPMGQMSDSSSLESSWIDMGAAFVL